MNTSTRRNFFGKAAGIAAGIAATPALLAQQPSPSSTPSSADTHHHEHPSNHVHDGIFYFSGTGANDGYPENDHVLVTDPFE